MDRENENNSKLDRLNRGLYSRKAPPIIDEGRTELPKTEQAEIAPWQNAESNSSFDMLASRVAHRAGSHHSLAKKAFWFSLAIFTVSVLGASFVFFGGGNLISSKNVDIKVVGPVSVAGGQEASFDVVVLNKNNTELESVNLTVEYPAGVQESTSLGESVASRKFSLGNIPSGKDATQTIKVFIFGKKEEVKQFKLSVDYKVKNSNANFLKEKVHEISISSSPIIVTSTYPKEINSNQEINFSIEVASNSSTTTLEDFLISVDYPFGFNFKSAVPAPTSGNNTWPISNLKPGGKKTINIVGTLAGQDNEERVFKVNAGSPDANDERKIGLTFISSNESIFIKKPFLGLGLRLGGTESDYVARDSSSIGASLIVRNNLPEKLFNVETRVQFSGSAFSGANVSAGENGFFRSVDNSIFWDKRAVSEFTELGPGDNKSLSFNFFPASPESLPKGLATAPEIKVKVISDADRILESGAVEHVQSVLERNVRLATNLLIKQKIVRNEGSIVNMGPIPPRANNKTTYTVVWSISNSYNAASNVVVKALLPSYVEWTSLVNPINSGISFDANSHQVIWNAGQVAGGVGYGSNVPKTVMFQISFLPSTSQVNTEPQLVENAFITGIDKITGTSIDSSTSGLSTHFSDSSYKEGDERVQN